MGRLIDHLLTTEVDGLFFLGSARKFAHMSDALRTQVMIFCIGHITGRKSVLVGITHSDTQVTLTFGRLAQEYGADGG
ncbi:dihydrodipicolinate synthase family protein [Sodalis-like endosymbiont of Proechinophthirus fluctus]|uniref:dihydrodipicolinate synthase family protein n=1 Tax=Sodalis-like endosymbiont of Proechinophthirus fluctus TaxID=1462730 RepID=UPI00211020DC|nr:dihydrodipicolinate synthase family protein [Sodalis-like endosymbiont of Proechinophthirus fluctus]